MTGQRTAHGSVTCDRIYKAKPWKVRVNATHIGRFATRDEAESARSISAKHYRETGQILKIRSKPVMRKLGRK